MKTQIPNIDVVRSAWRRVKKDIKEAIIRDLKPVKDVKGGGGFEGKFQIHQRRHWHHGQPLKRRKSCTPLALFVPSASLGM